jgi:hypothetical protein
MAARSVTAISRKAAKTQSECSLGCVFAAFWFCGGVAELAKIRTIC